MKQFIPGMRIVKTVLAVMICLIVSYLVGYKDPFYATLACVIMMKNSHKESFRSGTERVLGTVAGGLISGGFILLMDFAGIHWNLWVNVLVIPAVLLADLVICKGTRMPEYAIQMSCVLVLVVMLRHSATQADTIYYVISRIIETTIGIVIAFLVNRFVNLPASWFPKERS